MFLIQSLEIPDTLQCLFTAKPISNVIFLFLVFFLQCGIELHSSLVARSFFVAHFSFVDGSLPAYFVYFDLSFVAIHFIFK